MLFIGSIYTKNLIEQLRRERSHIDFAANSFQSSILEGLVPLYDDTIVVTCPVVSPFPKSHIFFNKKGISYEDFRSVVKVISLSFVNIPLIKMFTEYTSLRRFLKHSCKDDIVYIYALHSPFLYAVYKNRRRFQRVCVIVPDLPQHMSNNRGVLRRLLKRVNNRIINKCLRAFDCFVLLSPYMKDLLPIANKPWIQVEGVYSDYFGHDNHTVLKSKNTVLYSGIISSRYGVFDLIEAFKKIPDPSFQLWLCGSCRNETKKLEEALSLDERISYFGLLPKEDVRLLQRRASLLVNPRKSHEEYTKYSFPSKTMEYLASQTPVLMCRLPAIPKEYDPFLFYLEKETIDELTARIIEICSIDENVLKERGIKARSFILNNKNASVQASRIVALVNSIR